MGSTSHIAGFRRDCRRLHIKDYSAYTRATDFAEEQLAMIEALRATRHLAVLGIEIANPAAYPELIGDYARGEERAALGRGGDGVVDRLLAMRTAARAAKDFAKADAIRTLLTEAGVSLEDTPEGPRWSVEKGWS